MKRCICIFVLSVVAAHSPAAAAEFTVDMPQAVQQETKADNLLLGEIPRVITEWTIRCTDQETAQNSDTPKCWTDAASALTRYTRGLNDILIKKVEQLQAAWLARAAQLQANAQTASTGNAMSESVAIPAVAKQTPRRNVLPKSARPSKDVKQAMPPSTGSRLTVVARKSKPEKEGRTVKLVQSRKHQVQALKIIKKGKTNIVPAAVQRPIEASRYQSKGTKSETYTIRNRLLNIEKKVECSTLICKLSKKHKQ